MCRKATVKDRVEGRRANFLQPLALWASLPEQANNEDMGNYIMSCTGRMEDTARCVVKSFTETVYCHRYALPIPR